MRYVVLSGDGKVITKSFSLYFLVKEIKSYLISRGLTESDCYYFSERELRDFIKKEGSDNYINIRKEKTSKNRYLVLSKSNGKRLFISDDLTDITIKTIKYLRNRNLYKKVDYRDVEEHIKTCRNIGNLEMLKYGVNTIDADKFGDLMEGSNRKKSDTAHYLNQIL